MISELEFAPITPDDLPTAIGIEKEGYPADEAGTESSFRFRQAQAGDLFLGAYRGGTNGSARTLVGYVCSTLSPATSLTQESMSNHVPNSSSVCIHSVCVSGSHRRLGIALALLKEYIARLEKANQVSPSKYDRVLLITHETTRKLYEKAGFEWVGRSSVVHGSQPWFEMRRDLTTSGLVTLGETPEQIIEGNQQIPPGVLEALHRPKGGLPSSKLITDFPHGLMDIVEAHDEKAGVSVNKFDLLCPRGDCGSVILKKGVGRWVERASVQLEPAGMPVNSHLPSLPPPPETAQWWLIGPSPMEFENVGFTRPVQPIADSGRPLKLLTCAECDLGPLGWCEEGGKEFWLACLRVAYRG